MLAHVYVFQPIASWLIKHRLLAAFACRMTVESVAGNITLQVHRDKGTFGQVSVFCFAQTPKNGANQGEDFNFNPKVRETKDGNSFNNL